MKSEAEPRTMGRMVKMKVPVFGLFAAKSDERESSGEEVNDRTHRRGP